MWFFFAATYSVLIALVIIFDRYIIKNVFTSPVQGLFITIPTSLLVLLGLLPIIDWPSGNIFFLAFLGGFCLQLAQVFYFFAMDATNEAGEVSSFEATYPILVALGAMFLGNTITNSKWVGMFVVVFCILSLTWNRFQISNIKYLAFIILDIIFLTAHSLIVDYALDDLSFINFVGPYNVGIILMGIIPFILLKKERILLMKNFREIINVVPYLSIIEVINILAVFSAVYAFSIGHPALVTTVMTTYPATVFLMTFLIAKTPGLSKYGFAIEGNYKKKILLVIIMSCGLGLISY